MSFDTVLRVLLAVTFLNCSVHVEEWRSFVPPGEPKWSQEAEDKRVQDCARYVGEEIAALRNLALHDPGSYRRLFATRVLITLEPQSCTELFLLGDQAIKTACLEHAVHAGQRASATTKEHLLHYLQDRTQYEWSQRFYLAVVGFIRANEWAEPLLTAILEEGGIQLRGNHQVLDAVNQLPGNLAPEVLRWVADATAGSATRFSNTRAQAECPKMLRSMDWYCEHRPNLAKPLAAAAAEFGISSCTEVARHSSYDAAMRYCTQTIEARSKKQRPDR